MTTDQTTFTLNTPTSFVDPTIPLRRRIIALEGQLQRYRLRLERQGRTITRLQQELKAKNREG